jgi:hypothetical protein
VSDVRSDRCRNTLGFLIKNVKEIFWDLNFLSEVTGCRKSQDVGSHMFHCIYKSQDVGSHMFHCIYKSQDVGSHMMSEVTCSTVYISHMMSEVTCSTVYISHMMWEVTCSTVYIYIQLKLWSITANNRVYYWFLF